MKYTPLEFQKIWNDSDNLDEVMKKTGFTRKTVRSMASRLRTVGIEMKIMHVGRPEKVSNE